MTAPTDQDRRLHHVGYVMASISDRAASFARSVLGTWDGVITHDPIQKVNVTFIAPAGDSEPLIELIEPADEASPVGRFLAKGGGLYHVCFEVGDLDACIGESRANGCWVVQEPVPATAFADRRIAWVLTREKLLVEYLEREG